nr:MAG TPA: hypothetical protein [Caudoviricetes sp.]
MIEFLQSSLLTVRIALLQCRAVFLDRRYFQF